MNRTEIINKLILEFSYKKYLEIGCFKNRNFNKIVAMEKTGVDPNNGGTHRMTSDVFFASNKDNFDIVFIDGLHHSDQVYRDVINSLSVLNENGTIVMHDCNPVDFGSQVVPRIQKVWNGDVWKAWIQLRHERKDLEMFVIDADYGCGIIRRGTQKTIPQHKMEYSKFEANKAELLNLKSVLEFDQWTRNQ